MPLPALNKAEQEFFSSKGEAVADSLKPAASPIPENAIKEATPAESPQVEQPKTDLGSPEPVEAKPDAAEAARSTERQRLIKEMGLVPLEALQEARGESRALKEEMRQLQGWRDAMTAQLRQSVQTLEEPVPDASQDPIGYQSWAIGKLAEQNQQIQQWQQQQFAAQQAQSRLQQASQWANAKEKEFTETHPDYPKAWKHVIDARRRELAVLGVKDEAQINAIIAQDAQTVISQALTTDRNPAEILWEYAKGRGFKESSATPAQDKTIAALERIAAGQQASGGLRGGTAPTGKMTPQELASMPVRTQAQKAAFAKAWKEAMS